MNHPNLGGIKLNVEIQMAFIGNSADC